MNLEAARKEIDKIDDNIMELLGRRFRLAILAGKEKSAKGKPILDDKREAGIIERMLLRGSALNLNAEFIRNLFRIILNESKRIQHDK